jgi:hypothetical protein
LWTARDATPPVRLRAICRKEILVADAASTLVPDAPTYGRSRRPAADPRPPSFSRRYRYRESQAP